ncbi:DHH family phosphoesterase [Geofilum rubicundum]|nr:DHH family phosphoesterase [Geofilum rubicundum]
MMSFSEQLSGLKALFSHSKKIVIVPHKDPDGDAIGASLGWYNLLTNAGHTVTVVSPNDIPSGLVWMKDSHLIIDYSQNSQLGLEKIQEAELFLFLDFNDISRTGPLAGELLKSTAPRVIIDHHPFPNMDLAQIVISDTKVSSTCELSFKVMRSIGWKLDVDAAECLYTGIMTDTGMLNHNSSHAEIYHTVAELMEIGINKDKVHQEVFHSNSLSRMRLLGHALCNKMELLASGKVALIALSEAELKQFDYQPGDTEGLVNYPLSIDGIEVSVLMTEKKKDFVKLSFRSRGNVVINKYSETYFSGGGHRNAAGGEMKDRLDVAVALLHSTIEDYLRNNGW